METIRPDNGNTFSFGSSVGYNIPKLTGSGTVIKTGPGQTTMENVSRLPHNKCLHNFELEHYNFQYRQ